MDPEILYKNMYSNHSKFPSSEETPLCKAASDGDLEKVKLYLPIVLKYINAKKLLTFNKPGIINTYETDAAFEIAAKNDHINIMKYLLRFKCIHDYGMVFYTAIKAAKMNIIDFILKNTTYDPSESKNSDLKTAIKEKKYDIATRLYMDERVRKAPIPKYVLKHISPDILQKYPLFRPIESEPSPASEENI